MFNFTPLQEKTIFLKWWIGPVEIPGFVFVLFFGGVVYKEFEVTDIHSLTVFLFQCNINMFQRSVLSHGHKINWKIDPKLAGKTVSMDVSR